MSNTENLRITALADCTVPYLCEFLSRFIYPWEMVGEIKSFAETLVKYGLEGFHKLSDGVLIGENVTIHPSATIIGPTVIGAECEIRPGAYIRGGVITGKGCVIGNSSELKNCILLESVALPHYNYVGDSFLGNRVHLGAGTICSNLKTDGSSVVIHGDGVEIDTGLRKLGACLGDTVDVGSGCVLNPGTVIGKGSSVYPLTSLRGVYPDRAIIKSRHEVNAVPRWDDERGKRTPPDKG